MNFFATLYAVFTWIEANQALSWALWLIPMFLTMHRGMVLDKRAERLGMPSRYPSWLFLGFVPAINIIIAIGATWDSIQEFRHYAR